jgi:small basic protein
MSQSNPVSPKVSTPVAAGAIATLVVLLLGLFTNVDIDPEDVEEVIVAVLAASTAVYGLIGYLKRDPKRTP